MTDEVKYSSSSPSLELVSPNGQKNETEVHGGLHRSSSEPSTTFLVPTNLGRIHAYESLHPSNLVSVTHFNRISESTNLNTPPANWLYPRPDGVDRLVGFDASSHRTGFSSFRMAAEFLEFFRDVDVIADAENIKKLLKVPYARAPISMLVHKVGKTHLIDDFDVLSFLLRSSREEWEWLQKFFFETVFESLEHKQKALIRRNTNKTTMEHRELVSKFLYRSLEGSSETQELKTESEDVENDGKKHEIIIDTCSEILRLPPLPEPSLESKCPDPKAAAHKFARNLLWKFEDIRMLIGSDMPIFGDAEHPAVSLRLHDGKKPINILTGMDYWLDNLMCQVPEVLMCYHIDGIVQKYELIKTEDLPNLESCKFSTKTVFDVAKNILSFLKSKAAKEGHTYWLFKGKDDDVVKLYDLTSLCEESAKLSGNAEDNASMQNPFRTAVSMLLYKLAKNILQGDERKKEGGNVQQLLEQCLGLLDKQKYPHIATSAHFMLSDLYIPDDVDPAQPVFDDCSSGTPNDELSETSSVSGDNLGEDEDGMNSKVSVDIKALTRSHPTPFRNLSNEVSRRPLPSDVVERCNSSLTHIVEGLQFLEMYSRCKAEEEAAEEKRKEEKERDNLRMSKPLEPIPMPYDDPNAKSKTALQRKIGRARCNSEGCALPEQKEIALPWYEHLKMVLVKKAFLVYLTLSENHFASGKYGAALRDIKRALNCYKVVKVMNPTFEDKSLLLPFAFGVAGDANVAMVTSWNNIVAYQEEYNFTSGNDLQVAETVEKYVDEDLRDWMIKIPKDIEEAYHSACKCYNHGIKVVRVEGKKGPVNDDLMNLVKRLGNVCNELGVLYMNQAGALAKEMKAKFPQHVRDLLKRSLDYLNEGLQHFDEAKDNPNKALLHCNRGRVHRMIAYFHGEELAASSKDNDAFEFTEEEAKHYKEAIDSYETALKILGSRKRHPDIWDMVTWELSTTYFVMGTQLQDFAPLSSYSRTDIKRKVTDLLSKSLNYCDLETKGPKLEIYQYRAAVIHYRLASMYNSLAASDSNSEKHSGQLRKLAESHYLKSIGLFKLISHFKELLRAQLELVSLFELAVPETRPGSNTRAKVLIQIFEALLNCKEGLIEKNDPIENRDIDDDEAQSVKRLCEVLKKRLQHNFLELSKFMALRKSEKKSDSEWAKKLYSQVLKQKLEDPQELKNCLESSVNEVVKKLRKI